LKLKKKSSKSVKKDGKVKETETEEKNLEKLNESEN